MMNDNSFSVCYDKEFFESVLDKQITDDEWQNFLCDLDDFKEYINDSLCERAQEYFGEE